MDLESLCIVTSLAPVSQFLPTHQKCSENQMVSVFFFFFFGWNFEGSFRYLSGWILCTEWAGFHAWCLVSCFSWKKTHTKKKTSWSINRWHGWWMTQPGRRIERQWPNQNLLFPPLPPDSLRREQRVNSRHILGNRKSKKKKDFVVPPNWERTCSWLECQEMSSWSEPDQSRRGGWQTPVWSFFLILFLFNRRLYFWFDEICLWNF